MDFTNVVVTEATESPVDLEQRWAIVRKILFAPLFAQIEEESAATYDEDADKLMDLPSSARERPKHEIIRIIYGACPKCWRDEVKTDEYGDPLCPRCGWSGETIPGELMPVEPEGEPMDYDTSITLIEGYKRRSQEHRARKKEEKDKGKL